MRINKISLYNFGSYEGLTDFDTNVTDGRNVILIGGKNGAGKTTLFTAMRICLYGYISMGYKSQNSYYKRAIIKLINNNAKIYRPTKSYVKMEIVLSNGRGIDVYCLVRSWTFSDVLDETFSITKNNCELSADEIADFEKYLLSLMPPELFNLYFFDGEKIADFFLNDGGNERIKEAFLTLCGYDTFDIMRKNFKRIKGVGSKNSQALDEYIEAKKAAEQANRLLEEFTDRLNKCVDDIGTCEADIDILDKEYTQKGGITEEEWNRKLIKLKEEEKKRESLNVLLRKWANESVPFIMIREQVEALKHQIEKENDNLKYRHFCEVLESPEISGLLSDELSSIKQQAFELFGSDEPQILDLSFEQSADLMAQINDILQFDVAKVAKCKKVIRNSILLSARLRKELDSSNITSVKEYVDRRIKLLERKSDLLSLQVKLEQDIATQKDTVHLSTITLERTQAGLEDELKKVSIGNISARAIIMLDKLHDVLFRRQIRKVEEYFRKEIKRLMRKANFIDDICIDDNFNTHIYRMENFETNKIIEVMRENSYDHLANLLGEKGLLELQITAGSENVDEMIKYYNRQGVASVTLPVEIDKSSLSNGEKQIFIMALYHSLVQLCNYEIPFVIDTPFARIDTEHRYNISKHFFQKLKGQVFILSTNEEIDSNHLAILNDNVAFTYILENDGSRGTEVLANAYFEV